MSDLAQRIANSQLSFSDLKNKAVQPLIVVNEAVLEKDKSKFVGVPFIIYRAVFRPGVTSDAGELGDYVSCECIIADAETLKDAVKRGWIPNVSIPEDLHFQPEERAVFNDGSTGVRRFLVSGLHAQGMLDVGEETEAYNGNALYDKPFWQWNSYSQSSEMNGDNGEKFPIPDFVHGLTTDQPFIVQAFHGLRVSIEPKFKKAVYYLS